jgi:hypothetical protein
VVQNAAADREETKAYIAERLRIAGATEPVLAPDAVQLVHRYSKGGIPRLINLICEHAMITLMWSRSSPSRVHRRVGLRGTRTVPAALRDFASMAPANLPENACRRHLRYRQAHGEFHGFPEGT